VTVLSRAAPRSSRRTPTTLALASWDFERVLLENPTLAVGILRGLAGRLLAVTEQHRQ
jgi:hypothetical protein